MFQKLQTVIVEFLYWWLEKPFYWHETQKSLPYIGPDQPYRVVLGFTSFPSLYSYCPSNTRTEDKWLLMGSGIYVSAPPYWCYVPQSPIK